MPDNVTPEVRRRIMSSVRAKNTRLETEFRKALWAGGLRGWRCHVRSVIGTPDIVWRGRKVAVFIDSAWWHGHRSRWRPGKLSPWWDRKIEANRARDRFVNQELKRQGWRVVRVWDFQIAEDLAKCIEVVRRAVEMADG